MSIEKEKFYIPKYLDNPRRYLIWTVDEAIITAAPALIGLMISIMAFFIGMGAGFISYKVWRQFKGRGHHSLMKCLFYWFFPNKILGLKKTPCSSIRNYLG